YSYIDSLYFTLYYILLKFLFLEFVTRNEIINLTHRKRHMEVQGRIKEIFETKEYGSNGFRKRQLVLTTEEQYPQPLAIDFVQDKTSMLDKFQKGQLVKVNIDLRGREWVSPQGEDRKSVV